MKLFLLKIIYLSCALISVIISVFFMVDGTSDVFYMRFITPIQSSLIIGTSRAAQGLQPKVVNKILNRNDLFNYAFTILHSPYGEVYLNSIKKKLNSETTDGVFIVTVCPWSISLNIPALKNNAKDFIPPENNYLIAKINNVTSKPNFCYLIRGINEPYFNVVAKYLLFKYKILEPRALLHKDGWLEINVKAKTFHSQRVDEYRDNIDNWYLSGYRINYLKKTISFLKKHGKVFLVRLPVSRPMLKLEKELIPRFNDKMLVISKQLNVKYFNHSKNHSYQFTDGNHIYKGSGYEYSKKLAEIIKHYL